MRWLTILLLFLSTTVRAQCNGAFAPGVVSPTLRWGGGVGAGIYASTIWDPDGPGPLAPRLVIGGSMTTIGGLDTSAVAAFDGTQWYPMPLSGIAYAVTVWNGAIVAAGDNFVRRWNGVTWDSLGTMSGTVWTLQEYNGDLYAAGTLTGLVQRWTGAAWQQVGPGLVSGPGRTANSMTVFAGQLILGGNQLQQTGDPANGSVMAWNGSSWTLLTGNIRNVRSVCVSNGDLFAAGVPVSGGTNVARWDGATWQPTGPGAPFEGILKLAPSGQGLLAAGETDHRTLNPPSFIAGVARWNGAQWETLYAPTDAESLVTEGLALSEFNNQLYWGGNIMTAQGESQPGYMGLICSSGASFAPLFDGPSYKIYGLTPYANGLVAWGDFLAIGGLPARRLAYLDAQGWHSIGGGIGGNSSSIWISAAASYSGDLYVTGSFIRMGLTYVSTDFAAWDGVSWRAITGGPFGGPSSPAGMIILGSDLLAYGNFFTIGTIGSPISSPYLARYNGSAWSPFPVAPAGPVTSAVLLGGQLVIAQDNLDVQHGISCWDGAAWQSVTAGASNGVARLLAVFNGDLIVAGTFTSVGGISSPHIARWSGGAWHAMGAGLNNTLNALTLYNGELYAGGPFTDSGALTGLAGLARWNGLQWSRVGTGVSGSADAAYAAPAAMAPFDGALFIAGNFKNAGPYHSPFLARWFTTPCCGSADFNCDGDTGTDQDIDAFFACLSGTCPPPPCPNTADFNADGDVGTDQDIESFFRVLAGGTC